MEHTNTNLEAVLTLPDLDVELVQALSKHWLVEISRQHDNVEMKLFKLSNNDRNSTRSSK